MYRNPMIQMNHKHKAAAVLFMALFAAAGCTNPADPPSGTPEGKAVIRIGAAERARSRTVSPGETALQGFTYELSFQGAEGASHNAETVRCGEAKTVSLAPGEWTVTARGKDGDAVKAEGSWTGTVRAESRAEVFITLTPKIGSGSGTFTYTVEFPGLGEGGSASLALYEVRPDRTETAAPGTPVTDFTNGESRKISLPAGFYRVSLELTRGAQNTAAKTAAAHIYAGLDAAAKFVVTEADFAASRMVHIPGGTFSLGSPESEPERLGNEGPQHQVAVSSFYMGRYEVTQGEYQAVTGTNPGLFRGDDRPVEMVSWYDAVAYCNALSALEGLTPAYRINGTAVEWDRSADGYRLPTEAEWEYACRAGTSTPFNTGDNITAEQANYDGRYPYNGNPPGAYRGRTTAAGSFSPNQWGLYDMHGNVGEWCWDWYGDYSSEAQTDPEGPSSGEGRVLRGGSWIVPGIVSRSAVRLYIPPSIQNSNVGFRLVRMSSGA